MSEKISITLEITVPDGSARAIRHAIDTMGRPDAGYYDRPMTTRPAQPAAIAAWLRPQVVKIIENALDDAEVYQVTNEAIVTAKNRTRKLTV